MSVSLFLSQPNYAHHLLPVYEALPEVERGFIVCSSGSAERAVRRYGLPCTRDRSALAPFVLVGSGRDALTVGSARRVAHLDHGAGQTYHGDPGHPVDSYGYAGGPELSRVELFLTASEAVADAWRVAYPGVDVEVVGPCSVRHGDLGTLPDSRTVAITFHWPCSLVPECGSAWDDWKGHLSAMAEALPLLGHAHPRWGDKLRRVYERLGIPYLDWWPDVVARADVLVADNTSVMYEWAALGRPVLALNARRWRPEVDHGLRFWGAVPGPDFWPDGTGPTDLILAADQARLAPRSWGWNAVARLSAMAAYGNLADGRAPERAAQALLDWSAA